MNELLSLMAYFEHRAMRSMKYNFHPRKWIWKCHVQNGGHFVSATTHQWHLTVESSNLPQPSKEGYHKHAKLCNPEHDNTRVSSSCIHHNSCFPNKLIPLISTNTPLVGNNSCHWTGCPHVIFMNRKCNDDKTPEKIPRKSWNHTF